MHWLFRLFNYIAVFALHMLWVVAYFPVFPIFRLWRYFSLESEFGLETNLEEHTKGVVKVVRQVRKWRRNGEKKKMTTGRPGWKSISITKTDKSVYYPINVDLNGIISLEENEVTVTVEPGVMIGQLTRYLFKRGWTIPVVPELDSLSIGGLICGAGLESSSHKYGVLHDTVISYEVVLPDATVVTCSEENDPDLFHAIPGSYGTIGFLTAVTFPLIRAKRFVQIDYRPASSITQFNSMLKTEPNHDFVEAFAYSKNEIVVMFGDMVDTVAPGASVNYINRWYKHIFHNHAHSILKKGRDSYVEYVPLIDYYHRHSRGIFWVFSENFVLLNYSVFLFLFGCMLNPYIPSQRLIPNVAWNFLTSGQVVQDYVVPFKTAQKFYDMADELVHVYPVWLCPVELKRNSTMFRPPGDVDYLDFGFYTYPKADNFHPVKTLEAMEAEVIKCDGFQGLYADCFMSRKQFREMFDTSIYDKVRKSRGCCYAFPDVYDKVGPKSAGLIADT
ncbi:delta(24)-sterol reductase isoform X2 [Folsomia candida]|uniref:delta(24)-sterol reductase isoform X2 n=1 Tax=Folsomia candida TaxID=158441 RepID=UPI00160517E7|nr:delta(24)-sterol reductase isoform X2 [Folsomia candida]